MQPGITNAKYWLFILEAERKIPLHSPNRTTRGNQLFEPSPLPPSDYLSGKLESEHLTQMHGSSPASSSPRYMPTPGHVVLILFGERDSVR